jgi:hypothetical protein
MGERTLVRTIVCAYSRDELPTSWIQVHRRFEHEVKRAGLRIRVRLEPLEEMPESYEVVVVAPELRTRAYELAPQGRILTATRDDCAQKAQDLVRYIELGETLYAERASPDEPIVVVHRGPEIL